MDAMESYTSETRLEEGMRCCTTMRRQDACAFCTDVPAALGGKGEKATPGEMLAATVASCMLSMLAFTGNRRSLDTRGMSICARCDEGPQGIGSLHFLITVPRSMNDEQKRLLEHAALHCPVGQAIRDDIPRKIIWHWAESETGA